MESTDGLLDDCPDGYHVHHGVVQILEWLEMSLSTSKDVVLKNLLLLLVGKMSLIREPTVKLRVQRLQLSATDVYKPHPFLAIFVLHLFSGYLSHA